MSDSDDDYIADAPSDDERPHNVSAHGTRSTGPVRGNAGNNRGETNTSNRRRAAWEDIHMGRRVKTGEGQRRPERDEKESTTIGRKRRSTRKNKGRRVERENGTR